jgi:hypothetical protein
MDAVPVRSLLQRDLVEAMATYTNETDLSLTPPEPHYSRSRYSHEYVR